MLLHLLTHVGRHLTLHAVLLDGSAALLVYWRPNAAVPAHRSETDCAVRKFKQRPSGQQALTAHMTPILVMTFKLRQAVCADIITACCISQYAMCQIAMTQSAMCQSAGCQSAMCQSAVFHTCRCDTKKAAVVDDDKDNLAAHTRAGDKADAVCRRRTATPQRGT